MSNKKKDTFFPKILILLSTVVLGYFSSCITPKEEDNTSVLKIWFDHPTQEWNEGLPIGNGRLGAMLYGTPQKEVITLNEETIWSGDNDFYGDKKDGWKYIADVQKHIFEGEYKLAEQLAQDKILSERSPSGTSAYQMLAQLIIQRDNVDDAEDYRTSLDLETATVTTQYECNGVLYTRKAFASAPDNSIIIKYSASEDGMINLMSSLRRTDNTDITIAENGFVFSEHVNSGNGVTFHSIIDVETVNGEALASNDMLQIVDADEVILRVVAASDYNNDKPLEKVNNDIAKAKAKSFSQLMSDHIDDYKTLFDRVSLNLSSCSMDTIPTDQRLAYVKANTIDNHLLEVQYQFGRYLLISSSRQGTLPANLQGIWVNGFNPPWNSDYHININLQMNYWPAEMANLSECHEPFLEFIGDLREKGRVTAQETYGCGGFVAHHTSDIWHMTRALGKTHYGMWPVGGAWCCQHLYTHYEYTNDEEYLRNYAYPIMKEAAQFFVDFLVEDPHTGKLVSGPSTSPENKFKTSKGEISTITMGPTMDRTILFELFTNCIRSAEILCVDADFVEILKEMKSQFPPLEIGDDGRLLEWSDDFEEVNAGHRHISHLYALHPSNQISKYNTPDLFDAAEKTLNHRLSYGGGHTGWSRAWIINFWARLLDADKAHENILALQKKSTLPNLLDLHPPFQIDGNFGLVSGITEMLMQSHTGEIHLLPALPAAWADGEIKGIVARDGFVIDIKWKNGKLDNVSIVSKNGKPLRLRYHNKTLEMDTEKDQVIRFNSKLKKVKT